MRLLAWIEHRDGSICASFVAKGVARRPAVAWGFRTVAEARAWVESEAAVIQAPIEWVGLLHVSDVAP